MSCLRGHRFYVGKPSFVLLFPCQDAPCPWSLKLWTMMTGDHPDSSWDDQDTQLHGKTNFWQALISSKFHLLCQDALCPQSLELESMRTGGHPDRSWDVLNSQRYNINNLCLTLIFTVKKSLKSGVGVYYDRGSSWQELGCSGLPASWFEQP